MSLVVNVETRDDCAVIEVGGELDIATAPQAGAALATVLAGEPTAIVFDLSDLTFCDSTGLRLLVRAHQELEARGAQMAIAGATDMVHQVLEVSGLAEIFGSFPTRAEATAAVGVPPRQ